MHGANSIGILISEQHSYHFSSLQKSYHSNIWKVILSLHDKHILPDDKEIAASDNKDIKCRCPTEKAKDESIGQNQKRLDISGF